MFVREEGRRGGGEEEEQKRKVKKGKVLITQNRWDNRLEFCALAEQLRVNEFKPHIEAIIRGISSIIPIQLLYLF